MLPLEIAAQQIKKRREMLKINQELLAELSGVGLRTLKQVEAGHANPSFNTLQKIAEVLGMELVLQVKKPF